MHIILGYELDTDSYPDALGNDEARQGVVVLGPAGLVGVLKTRLGLTRIQTHRAIRIGQYLKRLKEADNNERFYSKSIRVDAWSTAKQVLAWRDELLDEVYATRYINSTLFNLCRSDFSKPAEGSFISLASPCRKIGRMAMPLEITPTELRKNVYKLLDKILEGGVPIEVKRKGKRLLITPAEPVPKLERLEDHPDCIVGDPEDLVHMDWSKEWTPYI